MSALEKVLRLAGSPAAPQDLGSLEAELLLAARTGARDLSVLLASDDDPDDDGDDDSSEQGDTDDDAGHTSHATFKALKKKGIPDAKAAAMCAKADKKVKASALADSLGVILAGLSEGDTLVALAAPPGESAEDRRSLAAKGRALKDGSYPIPDKKHLHKAAVLAASHHGDWKAAQRLIRKVAREEGVDVNTLPGFGGDSDKDEKVAATMVALAASQGQLKGTAAQPHPPFHGVHAHMHVHHGDNMHGGSPDRMPGHGYGAY
jgi:hypothetical protein